MKVGFLHSLIRKDEKLLIEEFNKQSNIELIMIDDRKLKFDLKHDTFDLDVVIERSINHSRALHALRLFESAGVKCVNSFQVASVCGDKLLTSAALEDSNITQPEIKIAFTETSALEAKIKAESKYDKFRVIQDHNYVSDFDKIVKQLKSN